MVFTAFLWTRSNLSLAAMLAFVNSIDNCIVYGGHFLEDNFHTQIWKVTIAHWTEIETALGYCVGTCYLYFYFKVGCDGFRVFILTASIHSGIGFVINFVRQSKYKYVNKAAIWISVWIGF